MARESMPPVGYGDFLREVKTQIRQRQYQALRAANKELLTLYWWLGEAICSKQAQQGWGKAVVETLAHDLQVEFPGRNGFFARNLWNMLDFYREYAGRPKLQPLVAEISWAKNLLILARCKDDLEREFYLRTTARFGWTKNVLQHQLENQSCPPVMPAICPARRTSRPVCRRGVGRKEMTMYEIGLQANQYQRYVL